jgi:multicomponent K+:H+ antiporter subunit E
MSSPPPIGWLSHPTLSAAIAVAWLLLQGSLAPVHWVAAVALGLVIPRLAGRFLGAGVRVRRGGAALALALRVVWDILRANLTVARLVLDPTARPSPAWVRVPLDLRDEKSVALLATIITTTPGTVSCVIEESPRAILVHALDCPDAAALCAEIKARYEAPLREILE